MALKTDQVLLHRYRVISLLAHGGMGSVYRAFDLALDRQVAIKQLQIDPLASERAAELTREQFRREARILASLDHPNLPRVTDHFEEEGVEYLVMDYVAGQSLSEIVEGDQAGLSESQVLDWADQLLSALEYIHQHGVIHRDVKPANIRLTPDGRVFLVDFGLVKLFDPGNPKTATIMHGLGTPEYAPPEQYDVHLGHTDPRSDIYALGATLYHLLTGQAPPTATQRMSDPESFQHPRSISPNVSRGVERVILRAVELQRTRRFASAADMRSALHRARRRNPSEMHTERLPLWLAAERHIVGGRRIALVAVLGLLIIVGFASLVTTGSAQHDPTMTASPSPRPTVTPVTATPTISGQVAVPIPGTNTSTPTATTSPTPTSTATSTPTFTFTPTSTPTRRSTSTPTLPPTPGPTLTPTLERPGRRTPTQSPTRVPPPDTPTHVPPTAIPTPVPPIVTETHPPPP